MAAQTCESTADVVYVETKGFLDPTSFYVIMSR